MRRSTLLSLYLVLVITAGGAFAQSPELNITVAGNISAPSRELSKALGGPLGGVGAGLNANATINPFKDKPDAPFNLGLDFSYLTFGRDKTEGTTIAPPYKSSFNYYSGGGFVRLLPLRKAVGFSPFIEGMLGFKVFNTRTKIDKNVLNLLLNDDQPEVINNTNDTGLMYSAGIGFLNKKAKAENSMDQSSSITVRLLYVWGDDSRYVRRGSVAVDNGFVTYETGYTRTDMIMVQLGITLF